ncbi:MAG TPA: HAMP domain-containing sensor histidine kinase [Mycobacteriales bacterium]|nr:HAMP domain-containing sensor histidine kinase [Mycobacteriales bacterium]
MTLRRRPVRLGLTVRLTLTFAVGALVLSTAVALGSYLFASRFLINEQQRTALHQTYLNAAIVRGRLLAPTADLPGILDALTVGSSTNTIIYNDGRWFSSSLVVSRDALPREVRQVTLSGSAVHTWADIGDAPQLVIGVPLPSVNSAYFQVFDESSLRHTLAVLRSVLLAAASATTAAGAALGWWVSRRLTAPLRAVASAARRLAAGNLETQLPAEADRELAGLVDSFNTMVAALRSRIERDARFAGDVSHELRSPLTTLSTSLSVLQGRRDELSARGQGALDLLSTELSRFERLVEDLLEISRADAATGGIVDAEPVRVGELLLNLLGQPKYADITADLDSDALEVVVVGDKRRLQQALRNLLDNAEAYAGGATRVTAHAADSRVVVYVDDAGPGVPVEERERIFDRFTRGRNAARRGSQGGTGLGLALVAEHVRAHGGQVWVADAPDGGARFGIALPAERR